MDKNVLYYAVVLTDDSAAILFDIATRLADVEEWKNPKIFCHHMTIMFHNEHNAEIEGWFESHRGETVKMTGVAIGATDKAIAMKVVTDAPSINANKHVTLATNPEAGGKPVNSNDIQKWFSISSPVDLEGVVTAVTKNR